MTERSYALTNLHERDILKYTHGKTLRTIQTEVLTTLQDKWDDYDVFAIIVPTGGGKSLISMALADWVFYADILVPTNILLQQYLRDYPTFPKLMRKDLYPCCARNKLGSTIGKHKNCLYSLDSRKIRAVPRGLMNMHMYMALNRQGRRPAETLCVDEAHGLLSLIQELNGRKMWKHDWHYPDWVRDGSSFLKWARNTKSITGLPEEDKLLLSEICEQLESSRPKYVFQRTRLDWLKNKEPELRDCILWKPVDIRRPEITPLRRDVKKLVLLSATFGRKDIESLGLDNKKVLIIQGKSPIPAERRPVILDPVGAINYGNLEEMTEKLAFKLMTELIPRHAGEKGVIHVTYSQSKLLQKFLHHPRLIWHNADNKMQKYKEFLESKTDSVLVASGLYEGIDLPNDLGRWQVVAKVPWLSLADPAIKYKAEVDKEYYLWETAKVVIQACGRVSRHENDSGITYVTDGSFERLRRDTNHLLPDWFKECIYEKDSTDMLLAAHWDNSGS